MTRQLHVLVVTDWYPSVDSPFAGVFVRDQALAVARRHRVTLLASHGSDVDDGSAEAALSVIRRPPAWGTRRVAAFARLLAVNSAVTRLRRAGTAPDVIHAHVFSTGVLGVLVGAARGVPVVVSEHYSGVLQERLSTWDARVARFTYRRAARVCPVSEELAQSVLRLEPRARCEVVPNVVDVDLFAGSARNRSQARGRRLLAVAGLAPAKGLPYLIDAVRMLVSQGRDVELAIVGDGPERAALESSARGLPVTFVGALARPGVAAHMREADVLALPSVTETFGIAALEGLAAGLPVVVTEVFPVADVVRAYGGFVVPPSDVHALAVAIAAALDGPHPVPPDTVDDLRAAYGAEAVAERLDAVYRSVLHQRTSAR